MWRLPLVAFGKLLDVQQMRHRRELAMEGEMKLSTFATVCFLAAFIPVVLAGSSCGAPETAEAVPTRDLIMVQWWDGAGYTTLYTDNVYYGGENRIWFTATDGYEYVLNGPSMTRKKKGEGAADKAAPSPSR